MVMRQINEQELESLGGIGCVVTIASHMNISVMNIEQLMLPT